MTGRLTGLGLTHSMHTRYSWTPAGMLACKCMQHEHALASDRTPAMSAPVESSSAMRDDVRMPTGESTAVRGPLVSVTLFDTDIPVLATEGRERPSIATSGRLETPYAQGKHFSYASL